MQQELTKRSIYWHTTPQTYGEVVNILSKCKLSSSSGLGVMIFAHSINYEGVCRTAPTTLGLLNIYSLYSKTSRSVLHIQSAHLWTKCLAGVRSRAGRKDGRTGYQKRSAHYMWSVWPVVAVWRNHIWPVSSWWVILISLTPIVNGPFSMTVTKQMVKVTIIHIWGNIKKYIFWIRTEKQWLRIYFGLIYCEALINNIYTRYWHENNI